MLAHLGKRHTHLFGNLQVEPLTIFLQALQDFYHGHASERVYSLTGGPLAPGPWSQVEGRCTVIDAGRTE